MQTFPKLVIGVVLLALAGCNGASGITIKMFEKDELTVPVGGDITHLVTLSSAAAEEGETVDITNSDTAAIDVDPADKLTYAKGELQKSVKITGKAKTTIPAKVTFKLRDRASSRTIEVTVVEGGDGGVGDMAVDDMAVDDMAADDTAAGDTATDDAAVGDAAATE
jgi:hypothetical protein